MNVIHYDISAMCSVPNLDLIDEIKSKERQVIQLQKQIEAFKARMSKADKDYYNRR